MTVILIQILYTCKNKNFNKIIQKSKLEFNYQNSESKFHDSDLIKFNLKYQSLNIYLYSIFTFLENMRASFFQALILLQIFLDNIFNKNPTKICVFIQCWVLTSHVNIPNKNYPILWVTCCLFKIYVVSDIITILIRTIYLQILVDIISRSKFIVIKT